MFGYPLQYSWTSLVAQLVKNLRNAGDLGSIPGLGRSPGEGKGHPLQYSGLENSMDCSLWGHKGSDTTEQLSFSFLKEEFHKLYMPYLHNTLHKSSYEIQRSGNNN